MFLPSKFLWLGIEAIFVPEMTYYVSSGTLNPTHSGIEAIRSAPLSKTSFALLCFIRFTLVISQSEW